MVLGRVEQVGVRHWVTADGVGFIAASPSLRLAMRNNHHVTSEPSPVVLHGVATSKKLSGRLHISGTCFTCSTWHGATISPRPSSTRETISRWLQRPRPRFVGKQTDRGSKSATRHPETLERVSPGIERRRELRLGHPICHAQNLQGAGAGAFVLGRYPCQALRLLGPGAIGVAALRDD